MTGDRFDVVVVGSRVAGASTALLLAKLGLRVLLADKARFPSDTLSSHQLQVPGAAALHRWGLLGQVLQQGSSAVSELELTVRDWTVRGRLPEVDGVSVLVSPRRLRLDHLLRTAANDAGADVADRFAVDGLEIVGGRVVGVVGRDGGRATRRVKADLVIGADGKNSIVSTTVRAPIMRSHPRQTFAAYAYWSGLVLERAEVHHLPGRAIAAFPTDDGLTVTFVAAPTSELAVARSDPVDFVRRALRGSGRLGTLIEGLQPVERVRLAPDLPHRMLKAHGPGWALVGDAGLVMDPVTAQGMTNAFLSAEMLAGSVAQAMQRDRRLDSYLHLYQDQRDRALAGMFAFTAELAALRPSVGSGLMVRRLGRSQAEVDRLLAVFSGVEQPERFFRVTSLARSLGAVGVAEQLRARAVQLWRPDRPQLISG